MKQIVVLQRGWIVVGDVSRQGEEFKIRGASVVRKWGTSEGLGQLVGGPQPGTILDAAGDITAHQLTVVFRMDVDQEAWS